MSTFTGYAWLLPFVVETAQRADVKLKFRAQQEPGVEMILNYPELEDDSKRCAQFRSLSRLYTVTGSVIAESFDDTTKCVIVDDIQPILNKDRIMARLVETRDHTLDIIEGL